MFQSAPIAAYDISHFKRLYKLGPELGRGGFGCVYTGFRLKDGVAVAIKFVARHNVTDWGTVCGRILNFIEVGLCTS